MVVQLIKHSFEIPPLEELALESNGKPFFTSTSHGLQLENQKTLWEIYIRTGLPLPEGPILDAGAGDGILFAIAPHMVFSRQDIGRRTIVGVDIDKNKYYKIKRNNKLILAKNRVQAHFLRTLRNALEPHFLHFISPAKTFMLGARNLLLQTLHTNMFLNNLASASWNFTIFILS